MHQCTKYIVHPVGGHWLVYSFAIRNIAVCYIYKSMGRVVSHSQNRDSMVCGYFFAVL
jgi:hypothetical protein